MKCSLLAIPIFVFLSLLVACSSNMNETTTTESEMSVAALRQSPDTLFTDTVKYCAEIYPWRDFMPGMNTDERKGLMVVAKVRSCDAAQLDNDVRLSHLWVVKGEEVWATILDDQRESEANRSYIESTARSGPVWEPGDSVWAVVGIQDGTGTIKHLRTPIVAIDRTE